MTLTKADSLGKSIFKIILMSLLFLSTLAFTNGDKISDPLWGASFSGLKHVYPGMIRTFSGLDRFQRTRIARFMRDDDLLGCKTRVYYSFKSNRLYEIQYDFKNPDRDKFTRVFRSLTDSFGEPKTRKLDKKPMGELFTDRSFHDYIWTTERSEINLRWTYNVFTNRPAVYSMFVTLREIEARKNAPRQTMSDKDLDKGKAVTIAFTGAFTLGNYIADAAKIGGFTGNPVDYPFALIKERFKDIDYFAGIIEDSFFNKQNLSNDIDWAETLRKQNFSVLSVFKKEDGTFQLLSKQTAENIGAKNITIKYPDVLSQPDNYLTKQIGGLKFGFLSYVVKGRDSENELSDRIKADISQFKQENGEIPVVFLYWDNLPSKCKTPDDMLFAQSIIESGAYLVVGYNPNGLMPIQEHQNGLIIYSPGKLLPSNLDKKMISESMIFLVSFVKKGIIGYDILPVVSSSSASNAYQVMLPNETAKKKILERFSNLHKTCGN